MSELHNVQVGDAVLYESGGYRKSATKTTVTRTTATCVMIQVGSGEVAFNRRSGRAVGTNDWSRAALSPWDDCYQHLVDKTEANNLRDWLRTANLGAVPLTTLREVARMLKGAPNA